MQYYFDKNNKAIFLTTAEEARAENAAVYKAMGEERMAIDCGHHERVDICTRGIGPFCGTFSGITPTHKDRALGSIDTRCR